jgi:hypothetical protein
MKLLFYILMLVCCDCFAQQDYIILHSNDTLYGKVVRGNLERNQVTIKNKEGTKKIHLREIKEWKSGKMPVTVVSGKRKKRTYWMELRLVVDGRKKLYEDDYLDWSNNYYIVNTNTYIQITKNNVNSTLISELMKCKTFAEKYSQVKIQLSKLKEAVEYYNKYCETP